MAQLLGHAAFHASLAGKIEQHPVFAERLNLYRKLADLESEKLSLAPPLDAGVVQKAKAKAQQVVIFGKIKLTAMSEGSLETAIGKNLLHNNQEETVRCDQTSRILESIGKQRNCIAERRTEANEAQAALENKRAELCQSIGLAKIEGASTLDGELRNCQAAINQNEKRWRESELRLARQAPGRNRHAAARPTGGNAERSSTSRSQTASSSESRPRGRTDSDRRPFSSEGRVGCRVDRNWICSTTNNVFGTELRHKQFAWPFCRGNAAGRDDQTQH